MLILVFIRTQDGLGKAEYSKWYSETVYCCDCSLRNSEFRHVTLYSDYAPTWLTDWSTVIRFPTWAGIEFSEKYRYLLRDPKLFWSLGTGTYLSTAKQTGTCRRYLALSSVKVHNESNYTVCDATAPTGPRPLRFGVFGHSDTHKQTNKHPWRSDRPVAEAATYAAHKNTVDEHSYPERKSNPQSQRTTGCRPTPLTARSPESADCTFIPSIRKRYAHRDKLAF